MSDSRGSVLKLGWTGRYVAFRRRVIILGAVVLAFTTLACEMGVEPASPEASEAPAGPTPTGTPGPTPTMVASRTPLGHIEPPPDTPTPTAPVLADCFQSFQFAVWQDLDGDGVWGESEPALAGVEVRPPGSFAQMWGDPFLSGADGQLTIRTWYPGLCTVQDHTFRAVPPEGYELTTPASITIATTSIDLAYEAQLGFRPVSP